MSPMNDEQLHREAMQEVDSGIKAPALWAKVMALAEGDEEKARCRYITLRVEELSKASAYVPPAGPAPSIDNSDDVLHPKPDNSASQTPHPLAQGTRVGPADNTASIEPSSRPSSKDDK